MVCSTDRAGVAVNRDGGEASVPRRRLSGLAAASCQSAAPGFRVKRLTGFATTSHPLVGSIIQR